MTGFYPVLLAMLLCLYTYHHTCSQETTHSHDKELQQQFDAVVSSLAQLQKLTVGLEQLKQQQVEMTENIVDIKTTLSRLTVQRDTTLNFEREIAVSNLQITHDLLDIKIQLSKLSIANTSQSVCRSCNDAEEIRRVAEQSVHNTLCNSSLLSQLQTREVATCDDELRENMADIKRFMLQIAPKNVTNTSFEQILMKTDDFRRQLNTTIQEMFAQHSQEHITIVDGMTLLIQSNANMNHNITDVSVKMQQLQVTAHDILESSGTCQHLQQDSMSAMTSGIEQGFARVIAKSQEVIANMTSQQNVTVDGINTLKQINADVKFLVEQTLQHKQQHNMTLSSRLDQEFTGVNIKLQKLIASMSSMNCTSTSAMTPRDCGDIMNVGFTSNGVYTVYAGITRRPLLVYCDMITDGGGWTVFQRRQDGSENFYRNWVDYANGFGDLHGEFWLGNDNIHALTNGINRRYKLRVDLADFSNNSRYAEFSNFKVGTSWDKYKLVSLGTYSGNAGDSLSAHLGYKFSTLDQDNDIYPSSCAIAFKGAWWYQSCHSSNLNGKYLGGAHSSHADGVEWYAWTGHNYSLKFTEMKLRPV